MAFRLFWARFFEYLNPINWVMPQRRKRIRYSQALRASDDVGDDLRRVMRFTNTNNVKNAERQLQEFNRDFEDAAQRLHDTGTQVAQQMKGLARSLYDLETGLNGRLATETPRFKQMLLNHTSQLEVEFREARNKAANIVQRKRQKIESEDLKKVA